MCWEISADSCMASMAWVQGGWLTGGGLLPISLCKPLSVVSPTAVTHVCGSRRSLQCALVTAYTKCSLRARRRCNLLALMCLHSNLECTPERVPCRSLAQRHACHTCKALATGRMPCVCALGNPMHACMPSDGQRHACQGAQRLALRAASANTVIAKSAACIRVQPVPTSTCKESQKFGVSCDDVVKELCTRVGQGLTRAIEE